MTMTPRQIMAWQQLHFRADLARDAQRLRMLRAAQAKDEDYRRLMRKLEDESQ
jgi:hypothetical protein